MLSFYRFYLPLQHAGRSIVLNMIEEGKSGQHRAPHFRKEDIRKGIVAEQKITAHLLRHLADTAGKGEKVG